MTKKDLETLKSYLRIKSDSSMSNIDIEDIVDFMRINCFEDNVDEEELDSLSESCCIEDEGELYSTYLDGFKAGYHKAKEL